MGWDVPFLSKKLGRMPCNISSGGRPSFREQEVTCEEFFSSYYERGYYAFTIVGRDSEWLPRLLDEVTFPADLLARADVSSVLHYAGREGTGALPHKHGEVWNLLVGGEKRWLTFDASVGSPGHALLSDHLTRYPSNTRVRPPAWFEAEHDELVRQASARGVEVFEYVQRAGDLLRVPAEYCHAVVNLTPVRGVALEVSGRMV